MDNINNKLENTENTMVRSMKNRVVKWILFGLTIGILLFLDQWTKMLTVNNLKSVKPFVILEGIFELTYVENRGAAFGMLSGGVDLFVIITCILVPLMIFGIHKIDSIMDTFGQKVNKKAYFVLQLVLVFLIAGALGNFIDRIVNGFVVDMLYFKLIDFPVFNVADIYVTLSTIILLFLMFFNFNEREIDYILSSKKKWDMISEKSYNDDKEK